MVNGSSLGSQDPVCCNWYLISYLYDSTVHQGSFGAFHDSERLVGVGELMLTLVTKPGAIKKNVFYRHYICGELLLCLMD